MNGQSQPIREQSPQDEAKERMAESTGLYYAPRMVAIEDFRLSSAAHRNRVYDAHRLGLKALGIDDAYITPPIKASDMGDLICQGDTYQTTNFPQAPAPAQVAPTPTPAPVQVTQPAPATTTTVTPVDSTNGEKKNGWLIPAIAAAGLGLGALGAGAGLSSLMRDDSTVVVQPGQPGQPVIVQPGTQPPTLPPTGGNVGGQGQRDWKASAYVTRPQVSK